MNESKVVVSVHELVHAQFDCWQVDGWDDSDDPRETARLHIDLIECGVDRRVRIVVVMMQVYVVIWIPLVSDDIGMWLES